MAWPWWTRSSNCLTTSSGCGIERGQICSSNASIWPRDALDKARDRRGAPVTGYTRISDEPIEIHSGIYNPDIVVVIDPTVIGVSPVTQGLKEGGIVIVNSVETPQTVAEKLGKGNFKVYTVDATKIALEVFGRPFFNTPMLGALARVTKIVSLNSIEEAIRERFKGDIAEKNITAVRKAYEEVKGL